MVTYALKILQCEQRKILKVCLNIYHLTDNIKKPLSNFKHHYKGIDV